VRRLRLLPGMSSMALREASVVPACQNGHGRHLSKDLGRRLSPSTATPLKYAAMRPRISSSRRVRPLRCSSGEDRPSLQVSLGTGQPLSASFESNLRQSCGGSGGMALGYAITPVEGRPQSIACILKLRPGALWRKTAPHGAPLESHCHGSFARFPTSYSNELLRKETL